VSLAGVQWALSRCPRLRVVGPIHQSLLLLKRPPRLFSPGETLVHRRMAAALVEGPSDSPPQVGQRGVGWVTAACVEFRAVYCRTRRFVAELFVLCNSLPPLGNIEAGVGRVIGTREVLDGRRRSPQEPGPLPGRGVVHVRHLLVHGITIAHYHFRKHF